MSVAPWDNQMEMILDQYRNSSSQGPNFTTPGGPAFSNTSGLMAAYQQGMAPYASSFNSPMQYGQPTGSGIGGSTAETNWAASLSDILSNLGEKFKSKQKQQQIDGSHAMTAGGLSLA